MVTFVHKTQNSYAQCVDFLWTFGLFPEQTARCPGKNGNECSLLMLALIRRDSDTPVWRCRVSKCKTRLSICKGNKFSTYTYRNGNPRRNLNLKTITKLVYLWTDTNSTVKQIAKMAKVSIQTIVDWSRMIREVCGLVLATQPKFLGTTSARVEAGESCFRGRRKNHKGHLSDGDKRLHGETKARIEESRDCDLAVCIDLSDPSDQDNQNYSLQVVGP